MARKNANPAGGDSGARQAALDNSKSAINNQIIAQTQAAETALGRSLPACPRKAGGEPMGALVKFPKPYRHPLPPDAFAWKQRHVIVFPCEGAWSWLMTDVSGGAGGEGLSKWDAINEALIWV